MSFFPLFFFYFDSNDFWYSWEECGMFSVFAGAQYEARVGIQCGLNLQTTPTLRWNEQQPRSSLGPLGKAVKQTFSLLTPREVMTLKRYLELKTGSSWQHSVVSHSCLKVWEKTETSRINEPKRRLIGDNFPHAHLMPIWCCDVGWTQWGWWSDLLVVEWEATIPHCCMIFENPRLQSLPRLDPFGI